MLNHSPRIVTDGLVLCLDAANPKSYSGSGTEWKDLSGNGNNGTLVNGVGYSSDNNGSMVFDGVDEYVNFQSTISTTTQFTISFWVNMISMPSDNTAPIVIKSNSIDLLILISARFLYEGITIGAGTVWAKGRTLTPLSFFINKWVQVTITYNGNGAGTLSNFNIYENNINKSITATGGGLLIQTSSSSRIGFINSTNTLNGNISKFSIYNRALTADEIQQNYLATKSRYGL